MLKVMPLISGEKLRKIRDERLLYKFDEPREEMGAASEEDGELCEVSRNYDPSSFRPAIRTKTQRLRFGASSPINV
jgi:hypothetical protein